MLNTYSTFHWRAWMFKYPASSWCGSGVSGGTPRIKLLAEYVSASGCYFIRAHLMRAGSICMSPEASLQRYFCPLNGIDTWFLICINDIVFPAHPRRQLHDGGTTIITAAISALHILRLLRPFVDTYSLPIRKKPPASSFIISMESHLRERVWQKWIRA